MIADSDTLLLLCSSQIHGAILCQSCSCGDESQQFHWKKHQIQQKPEYSSLFYAIYDQDARRQDHDIPLQDCPINI